MTAPGTRTGAGPTDLELGSGATANRPSGGGGGGDGGDGGQRPIRAQLQETKDQVVDQAKTTLTQARDSAASSLSDSKHKLADQISTVADAIHGTTDQLRSKNQQRIAEYVDGLAEHADRFAGYLRNADFGAMRRDAEDLARRQPTLVLGGAFVLGLLGARFVKSSERKQRAEDTGRDAYRPLSPYSPAQGYSGSGHRSGYERPMAGGPNAGA
jgi:hypothetical protein